MLIGFTKSIKRKHEKKTKSNNTALKTIFESSVEIENKGLTRKSIEDDYDKFKK